jgi:hypothetical protein
MPAACLAHLILDLIIVDSCPHSTCTAAHEVQNVLWNP